MAKQEKNKTTIEETTHIHAHAQGFDDSEFEGMDEQDTGLPPFWAPDLEAHEAGIGQGFAGIVVRRDNADPSVSDSFDRYVLRATRNMKAMRGSDKTEVDVREGSLFSISANWVQLNLDDYMGCTIKVKATGKRAIGKGKETWDFRLATAKTDAPRIEQNRLAAVQTHLLHEAQRKAVIQNGLSQNPVGALA